MADVAAMQFASSTQFWASKALPILQTSRNQIIAMLRRAERIKPAEIADVVLQDPFLMAQLLRHVNQRNKNSLAAEIVSVESAILLLGVVPFLTQFARHPTVESVMLPDMQREYTQILKLVFSARVARRLSQEFATQRFDAKIEEIHASALLFNFDHILNIYGAIPSIAAPKAPVDLSSLLRAWQCPAAVIDLLTANSEPTPRAALQQSILPLLATLETGWWLPQLSTYLSRIAGIIGQEHGDVWCTVCKILLRLTQQLGDQHAFFSAARWLVLQPGEWPAEKIAPSPIAAAPSVMPMLAQEKDVLSERMQALHLAGLQGAPTNQVMSLAVKAIADGLGMQRIAFALFMAADNTLRSRYVHGSGEIEALRQMVIQLDEPHIFTRLLQKPSGVWLNQGNQAQYLPLLPESFREQIGVDSFCAMSIFVGAKPVGLLYADLGGNAEVSDYQYQHFKQISTLASRALAHNARRNAAG